MFTPLIGALKHLLADPALPHDALLYGGSFLTLWLANVPAGAGWDTLLAAIPPTISQVVRKVMVKN